jgi:hypothetical protein
MPLVMRDLRARAPQWYAETLVRSLAQAGASELVLARPAGSVAPVEERIVEASGRIVAREVSPGRGELGGGLGAADLDAMFRRLVGHKAQRALSPAAQEALEKLDAWDRAAPDEKRLANLRRLAREGWATGLGDILAEIVTERLLPKETVRGAL